MLLTVLFAAIISTVVWYKTAPKDEMRLGVLCVIFWGASVMWLVDAVFEYIKLGADCFKPEPAEVLSDLLLGLSAVALGMVIWLVVLLISDPRGVLSSMIKKKK